MSAEQNYIFISYAHKDKKIVKNSIDAMTARGIRIWYDHGIKAGADWAEKIGTKLKDASLMLLFLSKSAVKSNNVRREIQFAQENNISILTVQVGNPKLDSDLNKRLAVNQFVNLKGQKTYADFAETVARFIEPLNCVDDETLKAYKNRKIKIKTGIVWKLILAIVVLVIAGTILVNKLFFADAPVVTGMRTAPAQTRVTESGFACNVGMEYSDDEDIGYIFKQNYKGKTLKNSQIVLSESLGPEENLTEVPPLIGYHVSEAVSKLVDANMKSFILSPVTTNEYQIAYVADQSIDAGYRVSCYSEIELSVSSEPGSEIELFGEKITLEDRKLRLDISDDGQFTVTPLMLMSVDVDYTETDPISVKNEIDATMNVKFNVSREDVQPFGWFRGTFEFDCGLSGDSSVVWKAVEAMLAEDGEVILYAKSDSFAFKLEPWDETEYSEFVIDTTNTKRAVQEYTSPVAMALISEIPITDMNDGMRSVSNVMHLANMFSINLPDVQANTLYQNLSIVVQENGEVWVTLYNSKGEQRAMNFHGNITYSDLQQDSLSN